MRTCPIGSINPSVGQRSTTGSLKTDTISSLSSSSTRHWRAEEEDETELRKWLSADTWHKCHACEQMPCGQNAMMQLKGLRATFVLHAEERHSYSHTALASFGKFGVLRRPPGDRRAPYVAFDGGGLRTASGRNKQQNVPTICATRRLRTPSLIAQQAGGLSK